MPTPRRHWRKSGQPGEGVSFEGPGPPEGARACDSEPSFLRQLQAAAGAARGDYRRRLALERPLGIPAVGLDRFIRQPVMQVLQARVGTDIFRAQLRLRPRRAAHQAVGRAREYIVCGHGIVVDFETEIDSSQRRHPDGAGGQRPSDKRVLKLIRGFLTAHVLA